MMPSVKGNNKLTINLAINYGAKTEIIEAIKKINHKSQKMTEFNMARSKLILER